MLILLYSILVLDPVMGDNGQLYVQPDVIPIYRELMKYAKAVTPNQFEAETLADKKIVDVKSCLEVIEILHGFGVKNVVITSVSLSSSDVRDVSVSVTNGVPQRDQNHAEEISMYCVCSSKQDHNTPLRVFAIEFPTYDGYFTGTGDLFSSLLVARLDEALRAEKEGSETDIQVSSLAKSCLKVVSTMKAVVLRTYLAQKDINVAGQQDKKQKFSAAEVKRCELRLIQSKRDIEDPNEEGVQAIELRL
ncbi:putative pyridoxal kinase [Entomortierella lignicola]|nr:putative pyridoxal kinase [Entomortierella lignicola]